MNKRIFNIYPPAISHYRVCVDILIKENAKDEDKSYDR